MSTPLVLQNHFQPSLYKLDLEIYPQKSNFNGELEIILKRDSKPKPDDDEFIFKLNSAELVILNAVFHGDDEEYKAKVNYNKSQEIVELSVNNNDLYNENQLILKIKYIGKINTIKTFRDFTKGIFKTNYLDDSKNNSTNYIIATHSQASFARYFFPSIDEPISKSIFQLSITSNENFKILSNTSPKSRSIDSSSQTITFHKTPQMNTSIFGFIIGDLDFLESSIQLSTKKIPLRFYTPVGQISQAAYPHDITTKLLPIVEKIFNYDYPLDKLDIIALPFLSDGAMENFGLITIQSNHILLESLNDKERNKSVRQLIAHELIHHWIGNNVSFDEWDHLWLNESFATWFAYYVLIKAGIDDEDGKIWENQVDLDFESLLISDSAIDSQSVVVKSTKQIKTTQDAFQVHSYSKGIQFLRMFANVFESDKFNDEFKKFIEILGDFISKNQFKSIKPLDIWKEFNEHSNLDLLAFTHSWLRTPGFPLVSVSINQDNKIVLEQHRYLEGTSVVEQGLEDVPYHVPLAIKLTDRTVVNKILNDRSLILEEITPEEFVKLNTNRIGLYRVHYKDEKLYDNLVENFAKLSSLDLIGIVHDVSRIIGDEKLQMDDDIIGFLKISEKVILSDELDFTVLHHIMNNLEVLENSFKLHSNAESYSKFKTYLRLSNLKLFQKLDWSLQFKNLSKQEIQTRSSILSIGIETPEIQQLNSKFFKNVLHGPKNSIPVEFLTPVFSSVCLTSNQTNWKKILELVKNPGATITNIFGGSSTEIQHSAIRSIGFTKDPSLVKRVLNFVQTNIDSNLVELALVGLLYHSNENKQALWDWFKLNYDHWVGRSLRQGSEYSANLQKTVKSITIIIFSGFPKDEELIKKFVDDKLNKLPEHGLKDTLELVKDSQLEKLKISSSINGVLKYIK